MMRASLSGLSALLAAVNALDALVLDQWWRAVAALFWAVMAVWVWRNYHHIRFVWGGKR